MRKTIDIKTITVRTYYKNGKFEDITSTFTTTDKIGISNFILYADEVIEVINSTKDIEVDDKIVESFHKHITEWFTRFR